MLKAFQPDEYFSAKEKEEALKQVKQQFKGRIAQQSVDTVFKQMFVRMDKNTSTRILGGKIKVSRYQLVNKELIMQFFGLTEDYQAFVTED